MAEISLIHRSTLAGAKAGTFGPVGQKGPGVRIRALPEGLVLHVLCKADAAGFEQVLQELKLGDLRSIGPHQWLVSGDVPVDRKTLAHAAQRLAPHAVVSDQSHGRIRIAVVGPKAAAVLAKGTAVDLREEVFPIGRSGVTLIGHVSSCLARTGELAFEITVLRSFAECLWDDLVQMGTEFGIEALPSC